MALLWGALVMIIIYVDPDLLKDVIIPNSYLPFFIFLSITVWYTLSIFLKTIWKSLILTLTLVGGLVLSMLGLMHPGLVGVILLTLGIESWYIYTGHEKIKSPNEQKDRGASI